MARSSRTGSASTTGSVSATSSWITWPRSGQAARAAPPITSSSPTARRYDEGAGLDAAHVEQVPDQVLSRSASRSIVVAAVRRWLVGEGQSADSRLDDRRLDRGQGVRRSWLTAARRAVRSSSPLHQRLGGCRLCLQPLGLEGDSELGGEGAEHRRSAASRSAPARRELDARRQRETRALAPPSGPAPASARHLRGPVGAAPTAAWSSRNSAHQVGEELRDRVALAQERTQPCQPAPRPRSAPGSPRPPDGPTVDQRADDSGHDQEGGQRDEVALVPDRERVDGLGEEPVEEGEADDRGERGRPAAADGGRRHDQDEVAERGAGEAEVVAERREEQR